MLTSIVVSPINHALRRESWACKRLQSYVGKTARVQIFPFLDFSFIVQPDCELAHTKNSIIADTTLTLTAGLIPRLLMNDEDAFHCITISGDNDFATALLDIGKNLRWDAEQDLSKIIGDIPAHRIAQTGKQVIHWHAGSIHNLTQALVEYWVEEQPMLTKSVYIKDFSQEISKLQDDVHQLEERIRKLSK